MSTFLLLYDSSSLPCRLESVQYDMRAKVWTIIEGDVQKLFLFTFLPVISPIFSWYRDKNVDNLAM